MNKIVDGQQVPLSDEEILIEIKKEQAHQVYLAEKAATEYKRNRKKAYPAIADQLDMIYWDKVNGTGIWQATIASIKNQFPKPE